MKLIILGTLFGLAMVLVNGKFNIYHWNQNTSRTVPYFFHGSVSNHNKNMVRSTMAQFNGRSCIRFIDVVSAKSAPRHHLKIKIGKRSCQDSKGNQRFGGRVVNKDQEVLLETTYQLGDTPKCRKVTMTERRVRVHPKNETIIRGGVMYMLFKVLGAIDTHKRMDRDDYIEYHPECVNKKYRKYFEKVKFNFPTDCILPYNCESLMHFKSSCSGGWCDSAVDCLVLRPKSERCKKINLTITDFGSNNPVIDDWDMVNQYYGCGEGDQGFMTSCFRQEPIDIAIRKSQEGRERREKKEERQGRRK